MIKAVIFDCFGVLTTEGWLPFKRRHFGRPGSKQFDEASELRRQADRGLISYHEFIEQIAEMARVVRAEVAASLHVNATNDELFDYIRTRLKPTYKVGFLSNSGSDVLHRLFTEEQVALFDGACISYKIGVTKPEPAAYQQVAHQLGIEPDEAVFIDDQERHCIGAREAGMQAILYIDFAQMKTELERLLANSKE